MELEDFIFDFKEITRISSRSNYILDLCRGKRVLHVGCVDTGLYEKRKFDEELLHNHIVSVAEFVIGVDIDEPGIENMKKDGFSDIYTINILKSQDIKILISKLTKRGGIDVIISGEVIEHVMNPFLFAKNLIKLTKEFSALCVITTPNPFYFGNIMYIIKKREKVHPDHNFYFSLGNLSSILKRAGTVTDVKYMVYLNLAKSPLRKIFKKSITRIFPLLSDGLIVSFHTEKKSKNVTGD